MLKFLAALLFLSLPARAAEIWQFNPDRDVWVNHGSIYLFEVAFADSKSKLIGGTVPNAADWPSSFASRQSGSGCTATLLSKDVLQLAAHCVGNGNTATIQANGQSVDGVCTHSPDYRRDSTADWALCKMKSQVDRTWYEKVLQDPSKIRVGGKVTLAGAGCTQPGGGGGFGTFRVGESTVTSVPNRDNDTVTRGGAALCYGDSGGSAFHVEGAQRWVMGVNSRGNIRDTSYLSSVFTTKAKTFYASWASTNGAKICGIHADAEKCQAAGPVQPPLPEYCQVSYGLLHKCLFASPRLALTNPVGCQKALDDLHACEDLAEIPPPTEE